MIHNRCKRNKEFRRKVEQLDIEVKEQLGLETLTERYWTMTNPNVTETYQLVSKIGYLGGVKRSVFENEYEPLQMDVYQDLENLRHARIIRNLCMIRTAFERKFMAINNELKYSFKSLRDMPELIPQDSLRILTEEGIVLQKVNQRADRYIMDVNRLIEAYIQDCRPIFPEWLNWGYIRKLLVMPGGTSEKGVKAAAQRYYHNLKRYPYQIYINWQFCTEYGNILASDKKFVQLLYAQHGEKFTDISNLLDAAPSMKHDIYDFLAHHTRTAIVCDCENADPRKLLAMLESLGNEQLLSSVTKIILYNDVHTSPLWNALNQYTNIPVDLRLTERVKADKSLVDIELSIGVCQEFYKGETDAFLLVSSDSDYWGLISSMPDLSFMVMYEPSKCSPCILEAMAERSVPHYSMDSFCTSSTFRVILTFLLRNMKDRLLNAIGTNLYTLLGDAAHDLRINLSGPEEEILRSKYLRNARIQFGKEGDPEILFGI